MRVIALGVIPEVEARSEMRAPSLLDQRAQDGALALAQAFAADLVGSDLPENAAEAFELVPPLFCGFVFHCRNE